MMQESAGKAGKGNVHETIERTADALHGTIDKLSDRAKSADDRVRERAHQAEAKVEAAVADVRTQSEQLLGDATRVIRANPLLSVGLALTAGIVLHKLFGRG